LGRQLDIEHSSRARADRLISGCRVALAAFATIAVFRDPELVQAGTVPRVVAISLLAYSLFMVFVTWRSHALLFATRLIVHIIDLGCYATLVVLTHGANAPLFAFFVFGLFAAMLRFGSRGVLPTAFAGAGAYVVATAVGGAPTHDQLSYVGIRVASLAVVTIIVLYISLHEEQNRSEIQELASWPMLRLPDRKSAAKDILTRTCEVLDLDRAAIVWEEGDEPWVHVATLDGGELQLATQGPQYAESLIVESLRDSSFFMRSGDADRAFVHRAGGEALHRGNPFAGPLPLERRDEAIITAPLVGESVRGRLFLYKKGVVGIDELMIASLATRLVLGSLEQLQYVNRMRQSAVQDERLRLARDLHDWLLQALTGAAVQIEIARRSLPEGESEANTRLQKVEELIESDQAELRNFISRLRPQSADYPRTPPLRARLTSLAERFQRQWELKVEMQITPPQPILSEAMTVELYSLVNEAVANAARHAKATKVSVWIDLEENDAFIKVIDDGKGFPFLGDFSLDELNAQRRGPVTLKERVASLGGMLILNSTTSGSKVEMRVPRA
jgi:signal transduction histidine kinase